MVGKNNKKIINSTTVVLIVLNMNEDLKPFISLNLPYINKKYHVLYVEHDNYNFSDMQLSKHI